MVCPTTYSQSNQPINKLNTFKEASLPLTEHKDDEGNNIKLEVTKLL